MNENHQAILAALKSEIDSEYGESALWLFAGGGQLEVFGTFSSSVKEANAKPYGKSARGQLSVDYTKAAFAMAPGDVPGAENDTLIVNGVEYLVLPFKPGTFETVIPLKVSENKSHDWK